MIQFRVPRRLIGQRRRTVAVVGQIGRRRSGLAVVVGSGAAGGGQRRDAAAAAAAAAASAASAASADADRHLHVVVVVGAEPPQAFAAVVDGTLRVAVQRQRTCSRTPFFLSFTVWRKHFSLSLSLSLSLSHCSGRPRRPHHRQRHSGRSVPMRPHANQATCKSGPADPLIGLFSLPTKERKKRKKKKETFGTAASRVPNDTTEPRKAKAETFFFVGFLVFFGLPIKRLG